METTVDELIAARELLTDVRLKLCDCMALIINSQTLLNAMTTSDINDDNSERCKSALERINHCNAPIEQQIRDIKAAIASLS